MRLGRSFGNSTQFWLDLQSRYDIAIVERESGAENCPTCPPGGRGVTISLPPRRTLFFNDIKVGMTERLKKTIAAFDVVGFASISRKWRIRLR